MKRSTDTVTYYKILDKDMRSCHGGDFQYALGEPTQRIDKPVGCPASDGVYRGYFIVTAEQIARWLYADSEALLPLTLLEVSAEDVCDLGDKFVARQVTPLRVVGTLDEYDLRWLATEFAILALPNTDDPRIGELINVARAYSLGLADDAALSAAWSATWSAARSAARSEAARSAAWSAAWSAARSAAWSAAWSAESAARSATWSAAWSAAESAAWSAAWSAAESAAWSACGLLILDYLED